MMKKAIEIHRLLLLFKSINSNLTAEIDWVTWKMIEPMLGKWDLNRVWFSWWIA